MKRSRNIPRFHSKQTMKHACQCEGVRVARRLLALFGEQSFIFVQDLNTSFHNIQKTPLTRSGFETMFLHCIKSARFDARQHESPSNASMWKYTFGCWRQWQEPNLTHPAVFRGENTGSSLNSGWIPSLCPGLSSHLETQFQTMGDCSFMVSAPALWNRLPWSIGDWRPLTVLSVQWKHFYSEQEARSSSIRIYELTNAPVFK